MPLAVRYRRNLALQVLLWPLAASARARHLPSGLLRIKSVKRTQPISHRRVEGNHVQLEQHVWYESNDRHQQQSQPEWYIAHGREEAAVELTIGPFAHHDSLRPIVGVMHQKPQRAANPHAGELQRRVHSHLQRQLQISHHHDVEIDC
eukprot:4333079-Prymnesium_polylepis.1